MNRVYVLVATASDAAFLRAILPPELLANAEVVSAVRSGAIASLARSLIVRRNCPVAVVMDSDSINPEVAEERRQSTEGLIRAAHASIPVKVVAVVPTIEVWFFASPKLIERVVGGGVPELLALGTRDPKGVLQQLAKSNQKTWDIFGAIKALDAADIELIRAVPEVVELSRFLQDMQKSEQAA